MNRQQGTAIVEGLRKAQAPGRCRGPAGQRCPPDRLAATVGPARQVLVEGALAKDPDHRFPSAEVMIAALDEAFYSLDQLAI